MTNVRTRTTPSAPWRWLLSIAAAACAAALFWGFHCAHQQAREKRQWPQRLAVVAETAVLRGDWGQAEGDTHCAHSVVQFQWKGRVHTAMLQRSDWFCGLEHVAHRWAHQLSQGWPQGSEVLVHVNPERPAQVHSADIQLSWMQYLFLLAGCLLALVPIGFFCEAPREAGAPQERGG